jgi:hypothetical protein
MVKHTTTLTLDAEVFQRFKAKVDNVSGEVESFMRRRLSELDGQDTLQISQVDYEKLRENQIELSRETDKIVKGLKEQHVLEGLMATANEQGLNLKDLNNLDETIPKLFNAWKDAPDYIHRYITFLEKIKEKWNVEQQLLKIRNTPNLQS